MPNYHGCPCEGCGQPLTLKDDIVVCPECGAPYHRACYEKLGRCVHYHAHRAGYEWKFPYSDDELRTCPLCGERTLRDEPVCRCCGQTMPRESVLHQSFKSDAAGQEDKKGEGSFDYSRMYDTSSPEELMREFHRAAFGKEDQMDGISCTDWEAYIGPAANSYMSTYSRMLVRRSKISLSFSALIFGPFYFFYRKAWKPAFAFLAAELLLSLPTLIDMMQVTGSSLAPAISASTVLVLARVCSALSFVLMLVRGLFGKWLYRKNAAERIRRIEARFPDEGQRRAVLTAQGGVSFAAVFGAALLLIVIGSASTLLLGPNVEALLNLMYGVTFAS